MTDMYIDMAVMGCCFAPHADDRKKTLNLEFILEFLYPVGVLPPEKNFIKRQFPFIRLFEPCKGW